MILRKKQGIAGAGMALWVFTIAIIIILLLFIFSSKAIREINKSESGLKVYAGKEIGLGNIAKYMNEKFSKIMEARSLKMEERNG